MNDKKIIDMVVRWILGMAINALLLIFLFCENAQAIDVSSGWDKRLDFSKQVVYGESIFPDMDHLHIFNSPFSELQGNIEEIIEIKPNDRFSIIGSWDDNKWVLIALPMENDRWRPCWVKRPDVSYNDGDIWWYIYGDKGEERIYPVHFNRELKTIIENCTLTDVPGNNQRSLAKLHPGDSIIQMAVTKVDEEEWAYIETQTDDQVLWGFVQTQVATNAADSLCWIEDRTLVIRDGVTEIWHGGNSFNPGDIWIDHIDLRWENNGPLHSIRFPNTLTYLGENTIQGATLEELILPETLLDVDQKSLYRCTVDKIVVQKNYTGGIIYGAESKIRTWVVETGNPIYSSQDGVLFSADGKILLSYPNGRPGQHYDVPRGTEVIGPEAFKDEYSEIQLRTISLPLGLKRIEEYAFSGCGSLISLVVPLTAKDVDPYAFGGCISLERVSMPIAAKEQIDEYLKQERLDGMDVDWEEWEDWRSEEEKIQKELVWYEGDNGGNAIVEGYDAEEGYRAWLFGVNGEGDVPVYEDEESEVVVEYLPSGTEVSIQRSAVYNGRMELGYDKWVCRKNVLPFARNPFFEISSITPNTEGKAILDQQGFEWQKAETHLSSGPFCELEIYDPKMDSLDRAVLSLNQVIIKREYMGDERTLAMLITDSVETPIRIFDEPDGVPLAWTYCKEQAEVLEQKNGWDKIRTARTEGWVKASYVRVIEQD